MHLPPSLTLGLFICAVMITVALISLVWTAQNPLVMHLDHRLMPPGPGALFGTDAYGRNVASQIMVGARNALAVALAAAGLGLVAGAGLGLIAAAAGGWVDELIMRSNDLIFAFPALLIAVLLAALLGPGALNAILAIAIFNTPVFARVTRSAAQSLLGLDFVAAARLAGKSRFQVSLEHILPNLAGGLAVQAAIQMSLAVVADASLSYVGLGAQPPEPSWGRMLAEAQTLAGQAPWLVVFPGLAVVFTVLGLSLTGEGLADLIDPRRRREP
jgi:peptide/nickel transport system permease protein